MCKYLNYVLRVAIVLKTKSFATIILASSIVFRGLYVRSVFQWQTLLIFPIPHRGKGCERKNTEYTGAKSNTEDDERCVMIFSKMVKWEEVLIEKFNRDRVATYGARYQDLVVSGYNGEYAPRKVGEGLIHPEDIDYCKAGGSNCASAIETSKK
jgi:hypothetical protein